MHLEKSGQQNRWAVFVVVGVWFSLAVGLTAIARQNLSKPGLYYDEAVFGGLAKDFVAGQPRLHMVGVQTTQIFHRPFPLFVQVYLGALKSWLLMPGVALFGFKLAVLRLTNWFWGFMSILLFMLGIRRSVGLGTAVIAGITLACDPTLFFLNVFDWGAAISSLLCRGAALYLATIWGRSRQDIFLWLASFFLGLGLFNKIDFSAFLFGTGLAAVIFYHSTLWKFLREHFWMVSGCGSAFLLGMGPMIFKIPSILKTTSSGGLNPAGPGENIEKINTFIALYDGSYFPRLMNNGGVFKQMYIHPSPAYSLLGCFLVVAMIVVAVMASLEDNKAKRQFARFLLVGFILTAIGAFVIPGAIRIHHAILTFPFPQIIIATAMIFLWNRQWRFARRWIQTLIVISFVILIGSQMLAIGRTEQIINKTGGRGWWSDTFDKFCEENKDRADLTFVSLDWGFNEQLAFLTNAPGLAEPVWAFSSYKQGLPTLPRKTGIVYLAHAPQYSMMHYDNVYLENARTISGLTKIQPYFDREGHTIFYTIQFPQ
jgi:hypothetical protein